ncbi:MAG: threonine/serine exporter family protein [Sphaerochaetaceae bacterium]|jgi:uncharacterized membrane protein YjjP (DUF1212 family)|nr:threonine/serine exporter family protein [Sphaerochaetaceae bacterium]
MKEVQKPSIDDMLRFCCDIGRSLIKNAAEINRVEETLTLILRAYGFQNTDVFAIPAYLTVDIEENGHINSKFVRIKHAINNMNKLYKLNELSHRICSDGLELSEASRILYDVINEKAYPTAFSYFIYGFIAFFFTAFWKGSLLDCTVAIFSGLMIKAVYSFLAKHKTNLFFNNVCSGVMLCLPPALANALGLACSMDNVIIGSIMLLVPGLGITNVMRDVLSEDFVTAVSKLAEVLIVALGIAIGISLPIAALNALQGLGGVL